MHVETHAPSSLVMRNVVVAGLRTSVRLEPLMWDALREIAAREGMSVHALVTRISRQALASGLTSAIRVYIVEYYRSWLERAAARQVRTSAPAARATERAWQINEDAMT
ncbi:MAG TPA: ribbon-helix-helix domain-containing protein [Stellaceae bacterium]|nr:ribbon-helix-helix domain-containing protein [Stellaceae bacterium]